ncbi:MAG TPA: hypothetical protein VK864_08365, partial [Longimicrobiales bacterium]|nr:hypothetical protein [Longimicrobiales bacterium]
MSAEDRERLARRLHTAVANALEVPPDLKPRIEETAARLIARSAEHDPVALAWERTRERARRTAAIGAVTTVPALVPGIGTALAALGLVADWRYVAEQQRDLVLEIAALFGAWPDDPTTQARSLFLVASASAFASPAAGRYVSRILAKQVARRSVARLLPGAGAAVAGALNYIATISIGRAAIDHFAERAGIEVQGVVPTEVSPALPLLRNAIVEKIGAGSNAQPFTEEASSAMAGLQPAERDELLDLAATLVATRDGDTAADRTLSEL